MLPKLKTQADGAAHLKKDIGQLEEAYPAESAGLECSLALSDAVDRAVTSIWESAGGPSSGTALVAIGGYGRRHMCPQSDIDLLVLSRRGAKVREPVRALSYALWDTGFELGLLTATEKEAHKLAATDFDTRCAYLDARLVCGDAGLYRKFSQKNLQEVRRCKVKFLETLRRSSESRWLKAGDAGADLEPDLKRSKGALRDIAVLGWVRVVEEGVALPVEAKLLEQGLDMLLTVRQGLHLETRRRTDLLSMQLQIPIAQRLDIDEYELMRRLYGSCRPVALAAEAALLGPDPLALPARTFVRAFLGEVPSQPAGSHRIDAGRERQGPPNPAHAYGGPATDAVPDVGAPQWPQNARDAFAEILRAGAMGRRAFRAIDVMGALPAALREWRQVRHRAQRNIYHRWSVDVHSHETVCELVKLRTGEDDLLRKVADDSSRDWDSLLLAALLHDIGKGGGGDHSSLGERLADRCVSAIGIRASAARDVCWLVRHHLLLTQVATRRDISEEALIVDLAERVGSERRLRMLYLLSVADARATGPSAWTPWKANLVSQLFSEVHHLLERKELVGGDASRKASARSAELTSRLGRYGPALVEKHLSTMPRAWLLGQPVPALLRQSELMLDAGAGSLQLQARPVSEDGIWEVTVVAPDRPGLFSKVSGTLALHGFDVVSAQVFTREDGMALEVFRVETPPSRDDRFEKVSSDAARAIAGEFSLDEALSRKRQDYAGRVEKGKREPPEVIVDNRASDFYTVIEVHATDRIGLLYAITSALAELGMDIHLAKIATYAQDVVDSFYVRDFDGQKVTDPDTLQAIRERVLDAVLSAAPDSI